MKIQLTQPAGAGTGAELGKNMKGERVFLVPNSGRFMTLAFEIYIKTCITIKVQRHAISE